MKTFATICIYIATLTSFLYVIGNVVLHYKFPDFYKTVNGIKWDYKDFYQGKLPFHMKRWFIIITHLGTFSVYSLIVYLAKPSEILLTLFVLGIIGQYAFSFNRIKEAWNAN